MGKLDDILCRVFGYRCPLTVELNGDSLLHGYGVPVTPVQRIQAARPRWKLDDRTANGLRMETAIQTFPSEPHTARIIVIALGANDAFGMVPADTYRADLDKAVSVIRAPGPGRFSRDWRACLPTVSRQSGSPTGRRSMP